MNREEKKRIVSELINTRGKLQRIQIDLVLDGEDTAELQKKERKLDKAIDDMRRALHENWQGRASEVERALKLANKRVQGRIRDINNRVKRAERLVALLGDVEEVIGKVRAVLP